MLLTARGGIRTLVVRRLPWCSRWGSTRPWSHGCTGADGRRRRCAEPMSSCLVQERSEQQYRGSPFMTCGADRSQLVPSVPGRAATGSQRQASYRCSAQDQRTQRKGCGDLDAGKYTSRRSEACKLSFNPPLIAKVRDIVGLYVDPPEHVAVSCIDLPVWSQGSAPAFAKSASAAQGRLAQSGEKSHIQALERPRPLLLMRLDQIARPTCDWKCSGTTSLFAALDLETGKVPGQPQRHHRAVEFLKFLDRIAVNVSPELDEHIVMDNYGTHKAAVIRNWFAKRPRFEPHFTPTYGSRLNLVEHCFAKLTNNQARRDAHHSTAELERAIRDFIDTHDAASSPLRWTESTDNVLASIPPSLTKPWSPTALDLSCKPSKRDTS